MRRVLVMSLAGLVFSVASAVLAAVVPARAGPDEPTVIQQPGNPSTCIVDRTKQARPSALLLGERTEITLHVTAVCPGDVDALHIVLVLDGSGSMAGAKTQRMKEAATQFVRDLDLPAHSTIAIAVVEFNHRARTLSSLTNNDGRTIGAINRIGASGGTAVDQGIREGLKALIRGRGGPPPGSRQVMVVLSDGGNNAGCPPVLQAANQAKGQGILVIAICLGPNCDAQCLRQAATHPRYYYQVPDPGLLPEAFEAIRKQIQGIVLSRVTVTDVLPDNMRLVPDSANPEPKSISPNGDTLEWEMNHVPVGGAAFTYEVEPLEPGHWATSVEARGTFRDNWGHEGRFVFPDQWVTVFRPQVLPVPTAAPTAITNRAAADTTAHTDVDAGAALGHPEEPTAGDHGDDMGMTQGADVSPICTILLVGPRGTDGKDGSARGPTTGSLGGSVTHRREAPAAAGGPSSRTGKRRSLGAGPVASGQRWPSDRCSGQESPSYRYRTSDECSATKGTYG